MIGDPVKRKRGSMVYVPHNVLDEIETIRQSKNIADRAKAFEEMVRYSQVGREAEQILRLDFGIFKRRRGIL